MKGGMGHEMGHRHLLDLGLLLSSDVLGDAGQAVLTQVLQHARHHVRGVVVHADQQFLVQVAGHNLDGGGARVLSASSERHLGLAFLAVFGLCICPKTRRE